MSLTAFQIRPATTADVASILALDRATEFLPHWSAAQYLAAIAGGLTASPRCMFVATLSENVVGLAVAMTLTVSGEITATLETVGVAPSVRRKGIGAKLCNAVIIWARGQQADSIDLEVRSASSGVIALYSKLGFRITGTRPRYYRNPVDDATLMRLQLAPDREQSGNSL